MKPLHIIPAVALALASCGDFLDLKPLNEVVLENYWTEKADVQSVMYSCYSGLTDDKCLKRMFIWGEVRSDNVQAGASIGEQLRLVTQEELLPNAEGTQWVSFYQVINRCNTVIKYAPVVAAKDPNYTDGDMRAHIAEATALRSLCYFYLVRAFRDVPYVTTPSSDDSNIEEHYRVSPTKMNDILDSLTISLEAVRNDAVRRYPKTQEDFNCARITRAGIDALLCDIYLWQNKYQLCMDAADRIFDFKLDRYEEMRAEDEVDDQELELFDEKYPLVPELISGNTKGQAYNLIFGEGYSFESIFELGIEFEQGNGNSMVGSFFGSESSSQGQLFGNYNVFNSINTTDKYNAERLFSYDDCRLWECMNEAAENTYVIRKYVSDDTSVEIGTGGKAAKAVFSIRPHDDANWIIYRLTDVMLMKAEAAVELQESVGGDSLLHVAFDLVNVVNRRGRALSAGDNKQLAYDDFNTVSQMRELVADERRRELYFEGKRWFDMVRYALRSGDNSNLINQVCTKKLDKQDAVRVKLRTQDALFWPINKTELIVNPNLKQNPAYQSDEDE